MKDMRKALGQIAYWTLPQGITDCLRGIIENAQNNKGKDNIEKLSRNNLILLNRHKGERCFVLATGPSVREQNLSVLAGELCIAVSHFFLHKDIRKISPNYHILAPYHTPFTFEELKKVFCGFSENYGDSVTYLFGNKRYKYSIYNFLKEYPKYAPREYYYINYDKSRHLDDHNFMDSGIWDISDKPFGIRTVVYSAIQLAIYMGCSEIYLVGCDHDYLLDTKRVTNHHFYKEEDGVSDVEHLSAFTTERWFEEYFYRWKQYRLMSAYANSVGAVIYNATNGGMLDVFPRVKLDDVVNNTPFHIGSR